MLTAQNLGLNKPAYTVSETQTLLSLGRTSLYGHVQAGKLRATKCGRKTLFLAVDIAAFLNGLPSLGGRP